MAPRLNVVAQGKIDRLDGSGSDASGEGTPRPRVPRPPRRDVNKDLPLDPDAIAGLREQHRQYTLELEQVQSKQLVPEVDPNRAYPSFELSTTLILCMSNSENKLTRKKPA